jgi:hypothetical protein
MRAENCKIVFLTGTPIINYPNEIAVLFNILRGYIKIWKFKLSITENKKINNDYFKQILNTKTKGGNVLDYIDYNSSTNILTITKNPFGFINKTEKTNYLGVFKKTTGEINDSEYLIRITKLLKDKKIKILTTQIELVKALPDKLEDFKSKFIGSKNNIINMNLFKKRILGLTSYYRSAQENLMPRFNKLDNFNVVMCNMSTFQLGIYEKARINERKQESKQSKQKFKKDNLLEESSSTYRIFSRAYCNFVFPDEIERPLPSKIYDSELELENNNKMSEDVFDATTPEEKILNKDGLYELDEIYEDKQTIENRKTYETKIKLALNELKEKADTFLTPKALETYSPKFLRILENLSNTDHIGCHLVYSQFRSLEGIGILKLVLNQNGFAEFKLKLNNDNELVLDILDEDINKPKYVLYTGTETSELKEIHRNIYNGDWKYLPLSLQKQLLTLKNNKQLYGEIIKVFMITASGAEGISLKNTRYVHIVEPYWHPVRINQVIGRARRICSHQDLPEELQNVEVFLYLMNISKELVDSDLYKELRKKDISKITGEALTTDQSLFEISNIKEEITNEILKAIKESAIDCSIHYKTNLNENLNCFSFGDTNSEQFSFKPSIVNDDIDDIAKQNVKEININAVEITLNNQKYAFDKKTNKLYDYDMYKINKLELVGKLITYFDENNKKMIKII